VVAQKKLLVVDAGGGQGQFSARLAAAGHRVVICDVSSVMLAQAKLEFEKAAVEFSAAQATAAAASTAAVVVPVVAATAADATFVHCAAQDLLTDPEGRKALGLPPLLQQQGEGEESEQDGGGVAGGAGGGAAAAAGGGATVAGVGAGDESFEGVADLVLFHAVVEWMAEPFKALQVLHKILKPKGHLSCLFYNK
jgi:SAM-dependent methyltransferase